MNTAEANGILTAVAQTMRKESGAIRGFAGRMDGAGILKTVEAISGSEGKLVLSGCGTSGAVARKIAHTFNCIDRAAVYLDPSEALHGGMGVVREGDVLALFSNGGETFEVNDMIRPCRERGAYVIGVTGNKNSRLYRECDLPLHIWADREADEHDLLATNSIMVTLAVFDAICMVISRRDGFSPDKFRQIHPGGAVGKKLAGMERV